jgi:hypothetical protein
MFSIAISIMLKLISDATRNQYLDYAKQLLDRFVDYCNALYGPTCTQLDTFT